MTDRLLTIDDVREFIPVARSMIYKLVRKGLFPQPRKVGKLSYWRGSGIQAYIADLPEA